MRVAAGPVLLGALCNAAANGRMPYSPRAAALAGVPDAAITPRTNPPATVPGSACSATSYPSPPSARS